VLFVKGGSPSPFEDSQWLKTMALKLAERADIKGALDFGLAKSPFDA
jgi:hypothetical protein